MTDIINLLPDNVANQIAAGEVVQRPSSVIKELLENSIDAGATEIDIIIEKGGKKTIKVIDNGTGMSVTDSKMAFERHATSKIKNADETLIETLHNLKRQFLHAKSLGFIHPKKNKEMAFDSILPKELEKVLKILRKTNK